MNFFNSVKTYISGMAEDREATVRRVFGFFGFFFLISSTIFIGISITMLTTFLNFDHILPITYYSLPVFILACGVISFIIGLIAGSYKRSFYTIVTFVIFLLSLLILELSGCIAGYFFRNEISNAVKTEMTKSLEMYVNDSYISKRIWDYLQVQYNCCGVTNYEDWTIALNGGENLPLSCCNTTGVIGEGHCRITDHETLKMTGCVTGFGDYLMGNAVTIGVTGIVIISLQIIGIVFAILMARKIRRSQEAIYQRALF